MPQSAGRPTGKPAQEFPASGKKKACDALQQYQSHTGEIMRKMNIVLTALCLALASLCAWDAPQAAENTYTNSIGMEFVLIPAGSFSLEVNSELHPLKGIPIDVNKKPYRSKVRISKPFYLGKYEVTQEQWMAVMANNPSNDKARRKPVDGVSWDAVQEFIKRLNAKEGHTRYRLPTEMEWEYAARGGTDTWFFFMKEDPKTREEAEKRLADYAWFTKNSAGAAHPVGGKKPNPYGLYDIYGNVWEWAQDWYGEDPADREIRDYGGPESGAYRVIRGGSWYDDVGYCRSGYRGRYLPDDQDIFIGFRLALSPE
jgi:formylglycine-generating enzyme required for sulfatase activity